ncbi:hypothetical protein PSCICO_48990 [Pseudomonas cichorii]|uniref:DUF2946 domain-containing protein n=1 Tax=Pseudomonas serbiensis TaxID=3064350 RepID=A0ABT9CP41_9PSED|nr:MULTISPECIES: DUF2946 domain-containing protein [Pseudomonas]MDO7927251.1 DUF2946 domain-containing protein [Pseudomonas sp. KFB-138]GFM82948.1 hypothetical protein PSCICN_36400 [Pseudomonas cichorii]GFM89500.1 hypothetical protein PSCICO_48990 [Pseudomonas cichorii]
MSQRRTTSVWIACFAVLFSLLAMPLSPSAPRVQGEQLLWGSFCSGSGTRLVAISLGDTAKSIPDHEEHASMQHCACCSGSIVVVIPSGFTHGPQTRPGPDYFPQAIFLTHTSPRQQWPSANPRASPPA